MKANQSYCFLFLLLLPLLSLPGVSSAAENQFKVKLQTSAVSYAKTKAQGRNADSKMEGNNGDVVLLPAVADPEKPDDGYIVGPVQAHDGEVYSLHVSAWRPEQDADVNIRLILRKYPHEMREQVMSTALLQQQPVINGLLFLRRGDRYLYQWLGSTLEADGRETSMSDRFAMATGEGAGLVSMTHLRDEKQSGQGVLMPDPVAALGSMLVKAGEKPAGADEGISARLSIPPASPAESYRSESESESERSKREVSPAPEGVLRTEAGLSASSTLLSADTGLPLSLPRYEESESEEDVSDIGVPEVSVHAEITEVTEVTEGETQIEEEPRGRAASDRSASPDASPPERPLTPSCVLRFVQPSDSSTGVLRQGTLPLQTLSLWDVKQILAAPLPGSQTDAASLAAGTSPEAEDASLPFVFHKRKTLGSLPKRDREGSGLQGGSLAASVGSRQGRAPAPTSTQDGSQEQPEQGEAVTSQRLTDEERFRIKLWSLPFNSGAGRAAFHGVRDSNRPERGYFLWPVRLSGGESFSLQVMPVLQPDQDEPGSSMRAQTGDTGVRMVLRRYISDVAQGDGSADDDASLAVESAFGGVSATDGRPIMASLESHPVMAGIELFTTENGYSYRWLDRQLLPEGDLRSVSGLPRPHVKGAPVPLAYLHTSNRRGEHRVLPDPIAAMELIFTRLVSRSEGTEEETLVGEASRKDILAGLGPDMKESDMAANLFFLMTERKENWGEKWANRWGVVHKDVLNLPVRRLAPVLEKTERLEQVSLHDSGGRGADIWIGYRTDYPELGLLSSPFFIEEPVDVTDSDGCYSCSGEELTPGRLYFFQINDFGHEGIEVRLRPLTADTVEASVEDPRQKNRGLLLQLAEDDRFRLVNGKGDLLYRGRAPWVAAQSKRSMSLVEKSRRLDFVQLANLFADLTDSLHNQVLGGAPFFISADKVRNCIKDAAESAGPALDKRVVFDSTLPRNPFRLRFRGKMGVNDINTPLRMNPINPANSLVLGPLWLAEAKEQKAKRGVQTVTKSSKPFLFEFRNTKPGRYRVALYPGDASTVDLALHQAERLIFGRSGHALVQLDIDILDKRVETHLYGPYGKVAQKWHPVPFDEANAPATVNRLVAPTAEPQREKVLLPDIAACVAFLSGFLETGVDERGLEDTAKISRLLVVDTKQDHDRRLSDKYVERNFATIPHYRKNLLWRDLVWAGKKMAAPVRWGWKHPVATTSLAAVGVAGVAAYLYPDQAWNLTQTIHNSLLTSMGFAANGSSGEQASGIQAIATPTASSGPEPSPELAYPLSYEVGQNFQSKTLH